jgi:sporulation protein YlmC with PRC-barrel domain
VLSNRISKLTVAALGVAAFAFPASLQGAATIASVDEYSADKKNKQKMSHRIMRASEMIGADVENAQGENLGEIKDLAIDVGRGKIGYAVLSFGGFLGMGDKLFAIPFEALTHHEDKCVLDVPKERLKEAPGFDPDAWPDFSDAAMGAELRRFYGLKPITGVGTKTTCTADDLVRLKAMPSDADDYEGRVTAISDHQITIATDDGEVCINVAPSQFLSKSEVMLRQGDEVKIEAVSVPSPTGLDELLVATAIHKNDQVVVLRRDDGSPVWSTARIGG